MNWRNGKPPTNFVGFGIEYREPGGTQLFSLKNRLNFSGNAGSTSSAARPPTFSTLVAPIQKFCWVHFPRNAQLAGEFAYRVSPVFGRHTYVHPKCWVFDDELAVIGSANCNRRRWEHDSEIGAFVFDDRVLFEPHASPRSLVQAA